MLKFGAAMFFTDYSMAPGELGKALEERGFESVWAPEHSHIPLSRKTAPAGGGELAKKYYDTMDPFVTLTMAAAATKTLKVATGVCLVAQRDPIQTAKLVASIDQVSGGRFLFGIGNGWNQDEMENHGTDFKSRHKLARERVEAMKEIWTKVEAGIPRRVRQIRSDDGLAEACAEAASADHRRRRVSVFRAPRDPLRRRLDSACLAEQLRRDRRHASRVSENGGRGEARSEVDRDHRVGTEAGRRSDEALRGAWRFSRCVQFGVGEGGHDPAGGRWLG